MLNFQGKVALVTGAGSVGEGWGNGKATAVLLARRGAAVCGLDLHPEAWVTTAIMQSEGLEDRWLPLICNMTDSTAIASAVEGCVERFGRIDILVNNVGGSAPGDPVSMPEEVWQQQLDFNLTTAFLGCKHVLPVMERQFSETRARRCDRQHGECRRHDLPAGWTGQRRLCGREGGRPVAFSRSMAIAYVRKGIRVNTVIPVSMHTPLVEHRLVRQLGTDDAEKLIASRHAAVPMGRMGDAWDVAHAVVFLASDEAGYITATQLVVDGGMTAARSA